MNTLTDQDTHTPTHTHKHTNTPSHGFIDRHTYIYIFLYIFHLYTYKDIHKHLQKNVAVILLRKKLGSPDMKQEKCWKLFG